MSTIARRFALIMSTAVVVTLVALAAVLWSASHSSFAYADDAATANTYTLFEDEYDLRYDASVSGIPKQAYTGQAIEPKPTVEVNGKILVEGKDYSIDYQDNIEPGEAAFQIWGKGVYAGGNPYEGYFTIYRKPCNVKNLWASQHDVGKVLFKWTKESAFQPTGWKVKYRTSKIGSGKWSGWTEQSFGASTMKYWCKVSKNYVVEIHAKEKADKSYSQGIITTPAGGKYQAMKTVYVKNVATGKRVDSIAIKKGKTVQLRPDYEYPVANYNKRPRLYPNAALWDLTDQGKAIVSITNKGKAYTGGMTDGVVTFKGEKAGTTNMICRAPNGRTKVIKVTVTN